jgi:hypothetical protein
MPIVSREAEHELELASEVQVMVKPTLPSANSFEPHPTSSNVIVRETT